MQHTEGTLASYRTAYQSDRHRGWIVDLCSVQQSNEGLKGSRVLGSHQRPVPREAASARSAWPPASASLPASDCVLSSSSCRTAHCV